MNSLNIEGLSNFFQAYVPIESSDQVIIGHTSNARECTALVSNELECRGIRPIHFAFEPKNSKGLDAELRRLLPVPRKQLANFVVMVFETETMTLSNETIEHFKQSYAGSLRFVHSMSSYADLFQEAMLAKPSELTKRNATIFHFCQNQENLSVTTEAGTDLKIQLDTDRYEWISNRGVSENDSLIILPAGEIATFPMRLDGIFVADIALNINTAIDYDVRLNRTPVRIELKNSKVVDFSCSREDIFATLTECFDQPFGRRVGELGFGTNYAIRTPLAQNSHINERYPGLHLGFGQHNQGTKVDYYCPRHLDLICSGGLLKGDKSRSGINLADFEPSNLRHEFVARGEDVFAPIPVVEGHCCGENACLTDS